ncbi:hypothetical protein LWI29_028541 [Acer saccharum]|uniref:Uncharacterized protein n=1 Tax=Acer saccharum TaxID=4024 RepID=A0AA39RRB3_ACESA|nr:hypothetical protein LWI29_028541 [Acer saccharum]
MVEATIGPNKFALKIHHQFANECLLPTAHDPIKNFSKGRSLNYYLKPTKQSTRANGRHDIGGGTETAIEVSKLAKQMQSMQATMLSMQSFITNKGNASHVQVRDGSGDMSFNGEGCDGFQEEVQVMGYQQKDRGGMYSQSYNQKWRGHPNLSYSNNNALNSDLLSQEVNQGYNNNRGFYQGQGSGSSQANQWSRQENFNNQARQQQREAVLSDGQSFNVNLVDPIIKEESEEFLKEKLEGLMASAMEFLDEQDDEEERLELMEELVDEERINEIEEVGSGELETQLPTPPSDSKTAVSWVSGCIYGNNNHDQVIGNIRSWLDNIYLAAVEFRPRMTNSFADILAKKGLQQGTDELWWSES